MSDHRTAFQKELAEAIISSKAVNFEAIGGLLAKYAPKATVLGDEIHFSINHRVMDFCIPPFTQVINEQNLQGIRQLAAQARESA
ncbi:MAG: hypothetical protein JO278_11775 [Dyella sp.]|nr:hypothetical protein [Dyella sp.]